MNSRYVVIYLENSTSIVFEVCSELTKPALASFTMSKESAQSFVNNINDLINKMD